MRGAVLRVVRLPGQQGFSGNLVARTQSSDTSLVAGSRRGLRICGARNRFGSAGCPSRGIIQSGECRYHSAMARFSGGSLAESDLNKALYAAWARDPHLFDEIPGFKNCLCLRCVPPPGADGDEMDFLLLSLGSLPKFGLVECEGKKRPPFGIQQLLVYLARFSQAGITGATVFKECIVNTFDQKRKRGKRHKEVLGVTTPQAWLNQYAEGMSEATFVEKLDEALGCVVSLLFYYTEPSSPLAQKLAPVERRALGLALKGNPLIVAAIASPKADEVLWVKKFP